MNDKSKHFAVSFLLTILFGILFGALIGATITLIIGVLKEVYDKYFGMTGFDWKDILADVGGILLGLFCLAIKG